MDTRVCNSCNGSGKNQYINKDSSCNSCGGSGSYPEINREDVLNLIISTGGDKSLKKSYSSNGCYGNPLKARAYFVWRLARFHGGLDTSMPSTAYLWSGKDPYKKELEEFADDVAKTYLGTSSAAVIKWGHVMGMIRG